MWEEGLLKRHNTAEGQVFLVNNFVLLCICQMEQIHYQEY